MANVRRDDQVKLLAGKDRGKTGKVLYVSRQHNSVIVEGLNFQKKCTRADPGQQQQGGIVEKEGPIHLSNVGVVCGKCNRLAKVAWRRLAEGGRARYCRRCGDTLGKG